MSSLEIKNIAGIGYIQGVLNSISDKKIRIDGMFGAETLQVLNKISTKYRGMVITSEMMKIPSNPHNGFWDNGIYIFQLWCYYFFDPHAVKTSKLKIDLDGKWGDNTKDLIDEIFDKYRR